MPAESSSNAWTQASEEYPRLKCYQPLNAERRDIRLLKLTQSNLHDIQMITTTLNGSKHPGVCGETCRIDEVPRWEPSRRYCALSYCWGDARDMTPLCVEGEQILVRRHIRECLSSLATTFWASDTQPLYVWLDVLCIDQVNIPERNSQVAMMYEIYAQAGMVCAYLGPQTQKSDLFCQHVKYHTDHKFTFGSTNGFSISSTYRLQAGAFEWPKDLTLNIPSWVKGLEDITLRPYFTRLWVIQEIVFSRSLFLIVGDTFIPWSIFIQAQTHVPNDVSRLSIYSGFDKKLRAINHLRTGIHQGTTKMPLLDLFEWFAENKCRDPRDTVYALYGMANDVAGLVVDYNVTPEQVWWTIFRHHLNNSNQIMGVFDQEQILTLMTKLLNKIDAAIGPRSNVTSETELKGHAELAVHALKQIRVVSYPTKCTYQAVYNEQLGLADIFHRLDDLFAVHSPGVWTIAAVKVSEVLNFAWKESDNIGYEEDIVWLANCDLLVGDWLIEVALKDWCTFIVRKTPPGQGLEIKGQAWKLPVDIHSDSVWERMRLYTPCLPRQMHYKMQSSLVGLNTTAQLERLKELDRTGKYYELGLNQPYVRLPAATAMAMCKPIRYSYI